MAQLLWGLPHSRSSAKCWFVAPSGGSSGNWRAVCLKLGGAGHYWKPELPFTTQKRKQAQRRGVASESVLIQNWSQSALCTTWLFMVGLRISYTGWDVLSCHSACPACTSVWGQSPELHETGHGWHMPAIPAPGRQKWRI